MKDKKIILATLAALGAQMIFGFSFMFTKIALRFASPMTVIADRYIIAFLSMSLVLIATKTKIKISKNIWKLVAMSLFQPLLYFIFESYGIKLTTSAFSSVMIKLFSKDEDPVVISGYQFIMGGIFMIMVGLIFGGNIVVSSVAGAGVLFYLSCLSAIAYALWGVLLKHNPVSKVSIFSFTTPVFGAILSKLMLTESANVSTLNLVITLLLVSSGIIILNYNKKTNS